MFEIAVPKGCDFPCCTVRPAGVDGGQWHTIEGVVFAGGINRHIAKNQQISHGGHGVKAVIADDIPGQTGRSGKAYRAGLFTGFLCAQQRRAVNLIWAAAGEYGFEPKFLAMKTDGTPDFYMNFVIGLVYKWFGLENPPDFLTSSPASSNSFNADFMDDLHFPVCFINSVIG